MRSRFTVFAILLSSVTLLCVGLEFASAWLVLPTPDRDAPAFVPAAVFFARTGRLANPIYKLSWYADPLHTDRFLYHGPLFPWLVGSLTPSPTPRGAFLVIALFRAVTLVVLGLSCLRLIRVGAARASPWRFVLLSATAVSFLVAEAGMRLPIVGRPESLGEVFVVLATAVVLTLPGRLAGPVFTVCLGLLGATHPLGALMMGMFAIATIAWRRPASEAIFLGVAVAAAAVAIAAAIMAASPNGLFDTLHGERVQAQLLQDRPATGLRDTVWFLFFQWENFFYFAFFLLLAGCLPTLRADLLARDRRHWLALLTALLTILTMWFVAVRNPTTGYNLAMFSAALFILLMRLLVGASLVSGRRFWAAGAAALACALISSLALAKRGADMAAALRAGTSYDRGRALVRANLPAQGCVLVDYRSWPLVDDYTRVREITAGIDDERQRPDVVGCRPGENMLPLFLRFSGADCSPWATPGAEAIIADGRTKVRATLFGRTTSQFPPGYAVCLAQQKR